MISSIEIENFKCFEKLEVRKCSQVNFIVGDNGAGKTALLEAIFMALGTTSELVVRFRQFRGLEGTFRGQVKKIEEALWRDYFHKMDLDRAITIRLAGSGPEARSLTIDRGGQGELVLPLDGQSPANAKSGIRFEWTASNGEKRVAAPVISLEGFRFPETGEDLPDFFFFASNQTFSSADNADRFSDLRTEESRSEFVSFFSDMYPWITGLSVESVVGAPAIYATVEGLDEKLPITSLSGGINRLLSIYLAIATRRDSVILIDEIENGIYFQHHLPYCKALLRIARKYNSQIFVTTHSAEWLNAVKDSIDLKIDDVSLWRIARKNFEPYVSQFAGRQVPLGIGTGEVRG